MFQRLRVVLAGLVTLAALSGGAAAQAQTTVDTLFFCGVVGDGGRLLTTQGTTYTFAELKPSVMSVVGIFPDPTSVTGSAGFNSDQNVTALNITPLAVPQAPMFEFGGTLDYRDAGVSVATGEVYAVIFSTTVHRDAFLYYIEQREAATTEADYLYFTALGAYEFWMGQNNEGLALYAYYTGMADYLRESQFDENPQQAMYDYYYNIGLGAYYYFLGIGDSESAWLAFVYNVQLANEALQEVPQGT